MPSSPRDRLIALGASNLTRGFLALLDAFRLHTGGPVEVFAALGRGRSFGIPSRLCGRSLPGIDGCGLWPALAAADPAPTTALVMDVGNDILYGVPVPTILDWVARALDRLAARADHIALAGLPMATIRTLGPRRFTLLRTLLVPGCRLPLAEVQARAEALEAGLAALGARTGTPFRPLRPEWYGFDPMHVRRRHHRAAFAHLLGVPCPPAAATGLDGALARLRFLGARPASSAWFGRTRVAPQPACTFADGSRAALF